MSPTRLVAFASLLIVAGCGSNAALCAACADGGADEAGGPMPDAPADVGPDVGPARAPDVAPDGAIDAAEALPPDVGPPDHQGLLLANGIPCTSRSFCQSNSC